MEIFEEVSRRTFEIKIEDWRSFYKELVDILHNRFDFDQVEEDKFRHWMDIGKLRTEILCHKEMDKFSEIVIEIVAHVKTMDGDQNQAKVRFESKSEVKTTYPEETEFQRSLLYFAMRSIWDKLVYGWARERWRKEAKDILVNLNSALREFPGSYSTGDSY